MVLTSKTSLDTVTGEISRKTFGRGSSSSCPKGGSIKLTSPLGQSVTCKTVCKTWGCLSCRNKMLALFRARVAIGVSHLGRCAFITLTYKAEVSRGPAALYVRKDWQALWRKLRHLQSPLLKMKWLRVVEVTKKKTPHHHMVIGTIPVDREINCWGRKVFDVRRYKARFDSCDCVAHEFARSWSVVTGDSFLVHAIPVTSGEGAGTYMGKYLQKTFSTDNRQDILGMERRWSSNLGWPGGGKLKLSQTDKGGWIAREFHYGHVEDSELGGPAYLQEKSGENITMKRAEKARMKVIVSSMEKKLHVN